MDGYNGEEISDNELDEADRQHLEEMMEDDDRVLDEICPRCKIEYDEVDFEYQICHICKYNNNK